MVKIVPRSRQGTPSMEIGTPQRDKRDYPLVLLHVTLLPTLCPYSPESMQAVLPEHILENFRVLQTRMGDTTILGRGVLIQHPRNEYELLEEHLLESLDLLSPRILKCGHFCDDSDESDDEHMGSRRSSLGPNSDSEASEDEGCNLCGDCQSPIKRPQQGVGKGKRRWEVKIFAANGLMRSGAWSAAWSEMERVDAEIRPWIPEDLRKKLERMRDEEEAEARRIEAQLEEEAIQAERVRMEAMTLASNSISARTVTPALSRSVSRAEETPVKEFTLQSSHGTQDFGIADPAPVPTQVIEPLGESRQIAPAPVAAPALADEAQMDLFEDFLRQPPPPAQTAPIPESANNVGREPIPLSLLLKNYIYLQAKEKGHFIMFFILALLVMFCSIGMARPPPSSHIEQIRENLELDRTFSVTHTLVETTTAVSFSTVTEHAIETTTERLHVLGTSTSTHTTTESVPYTVTERLVETTTQSILLSLEPVTQVSTVYLAAIEPTRSAPPESSPVESASVSTASAVETETTTAISGTETASESEVAASSSSKENSHVHPSANSGQPGIEAEDAVAFSSSQGSSPASSVAAPNPSTSDGTVRVAADAVGAAPVRHDAEFISDSGSVSLEDRAAVVAAAAASPSSSSVETSLPASDENTKIGDIPSQQAASERD